jgi:hypothetical protein
MIMVSHVVDGQIVHCVICTATDEGWAKKVTRAISLWVSTYDIKKLVTNQPYRLTIIIYFYHCKQPIKARSLFSSTLVRTIEVVYMYFVVVAGDVSDNLLLANFTGFIDNIKNWRGLVAT